MDPGPMHGPPLLAILLAILRSILCPPWLLKTGGTGPDPNDHTVMCLLAEDNTIMVKIHFDGSSYASWCVITLYLDYFIQLTQ